MKLPHAVERSSVQFSLNQSSIEARLIHLFWFSEPILTL